MAKSLLREWTHGVIRSGGAHDVHSVNAVLEGEPDAATRYAHWQSHFRNMRDLGADAE